MADVAARAGVSRALVSIVFRDAPGASEGTRARVLQAAAELDYRLDTRAQLLRRSRSQLIGVSFGVQHAFHGDLVEALYQASEPLGYRLALGAVAPSRSEARAVAALLDDRCEGLILLGPQLTAAKLGEVAARVPTTVVARRTKPTVVDVVRTADDIAAGLAVDHLVALGHRSIVHIDGDMAPGSADRRRGYRTAMRRHGLGSQVQIVAGGLTEDEGSQVTAALLADGSRPTAIVAFNDRCAIGVLESLRDARVEVPREVSVVGFDDSRLARLAHVNLTTVAQDVGQLAQSALLSIVDRLEGRRTDHRDQVIEPYLVIRRTTASPSA
jgi:DNA-binding LacI/PurR family transcriptional regulator